jgi:predicted dehydrogenase
MNRRDFLRDTTLTSLTTALGVGALEPAFAQRSDVREEKKGPPPAPVPCAVIGLGPQGREIISSLARQNSTPKYICDVFEGKIFVKKSQTLAPTATFTKEYRTILDDKSVQAVFVATPTHKHKQIVLDALQAGKHVYCEAPLAYDVSEAREIARAGAEAKSFFVPGIQFRSNGQHKHVWKFVKGDAMGRCVSGRAHWHKRTSWRQAWPTPEREAELNWRLNRETSLGLVGEIGIHSIDIASWYLKSTPLSVQGWGNILEYNDGRTVPDTVQCVFQYPGNILFNYDANLSSNFEGGYELFLGLNRSILLRDQRAWMFTETDAPLLGWEVFARKDEYSLGSVANNTGDRLGTGIALVADATKQLALGKDPGKIGTDVTKTALYQSVEAFLEAIRKNKKPEVTALDGYKATVVAAKANEAILNGTKIEFQKEWFEL